MDAKSSARHSLNVPVVKGHIALMIRVESEVSSDCTTVDGGMFRRTGTESG